METVWTRPDNNCQAQVQVSPFHLSNSTVNVVHPGRPRGPGGNVGTVHVWNKTTIYELECIPPLVGIFPKIKIT